MPWLRAALVLPLSLASLTAVHAESQEPPPQSEKRSGHVLSSTRVQAGREEPGPEGFQRPAWLEHVHVRKGAGLEVRRSLAVGDKGMVLGVKGPVMKRKRLGLALEVRF